MKQLTNITDNPNQRVRISIADGTTATMTLVYSSRQQGWFYDLEWNGTKICSRRRLVTSMNCIRAFRRVLPFGLSCSCNDGLEPVFQSDFIDGRAAIYLLDATDVTDIEGQILLYA